MNWDLAFHAVEISVLLFGVAVPILRSSSRVMNVLRDFPPHRHIGNRILFPSGYEPSEEVKLTESGGK
ncbi:MAG: hypothetical protein ACRD8A_12610 [Candidatus Acidiferrales bacterium]